MSSPQPLYATTKKLTSDGKSSRSSAMMVTSATLCCRKTRTRQQLLFRHLARRIGWEPCTHRSKNLMATKEKKNGQGQPPTSPPRRRQRALFQANSPSKPTS
jgi:hypothetical protein